MAVYNPYNFNPYIQDLQNMRDRIDKTVQQYQQNQNIPQQPQIHQNFQIAPMQQNELEARFANNFDDVKNTFVMREGLFINRDMTTLWVKNISGEIKTYTLSEVIEVDPKDTEIANLKNEIANMRALISKQTIQPKEEIETPIVSTTAKNEKKNK